MIGPGELEKEEFLKKKKKIETLRGELENSR